MKECEFTLRRRQERAEDAFQMDVLRCHVAMMQCNRRIRDEDHAHEVMELHKEYRCQLYAHDQEMIYLLGQLDRMQQKLTEACRAVDRASLVYHEAAREIDDHRRTRHRLEQELHDSRAEHERTRSQLETTHFELFESMQTIAAMQRQQQRHLSSSPAGTADQHQNQQSAPQQATPSRRPVCFACTQSSALMSTCDGSHQCNNCRSRSSAVGRCQYPRCAILAEGGRCGWPTCHDVQQEEGPDPNC
ncbi:hypothetical protein IWZ01DRAFT_324614 [Phyllosticta capitalensis]